MILCLNKEKISSNQWCIWLRRNRRAEGRKREKKTSRILCLIKKITWKLWEGEGNRREGVRHDCGFKEQRKSKSFRVQRIELSAFGIIDWYFPLVCRLIGQPAGTPDVNCLGDKNEKNYHDETKSKPSVKQWETYVSGHKLSPHWTRPPKPNRTKLAIAFAFAMQSIFSTIFSFLKKSQVFVCVSSK